MIELYEIESAKCNLNILINVEKFRINYDKDKPKKVENHERHKQFIIEIYEVITKLSKENINLQSRTMELTYANTRLLFEIDKLKKQNKDLIDSI